MLLEKLFYSTTNLIDFKYNSPLQKIQPNPCNVCKAHGCMKVQFGLDRKKAAISKPLPSKQALLGSCEVVSAGRKLRRLGKKVAIYWL